MIVYVNEYVVVGKKQRRIVSLPQKWIFFFSGVLLN